MKKLYTLLTAVVLGASAMGQNLVDLSLLSTYESGTFDEGAMEILAHDPVNQRIFCINADVDGIDVFDISTPTNIVKTSTIDVSQWGKGANSVAYYGGYIVAAVEADDVDVRGRAVFFDVNGNYVADVEVGFLPDMSTFTPDGQKVLVANEGEPDDDYLIDPPGTISIIDVSAGVPSVSQADVTELTFDSFEGNYDANIRVFGRTDYFFEDFEDTTVALGNVVLYSRSSNVDWYYDDFAGDNFAEMNGFGADTASDDWMMVHADLRSFTDATFEFYSAKNFSGGTFEIKVSTDYDGTSDPLTATWTDLTSQFILSPGGYTDTASGAVSLAGHLSENTWIAFHYTSTGTGGGDGALWQIDDLELKGTTLSLAANLEPEYIAVSPDNSTAWAVCQENNAVAKIDLTNNTITALVALGFKDWMDPNNTMDASNRSSAVEFKNWPIYGMYQPDAMKAFEHNGSNYIITANEGDARDYDGYSEEERVEDLTLDATAFPNAADLQNEDSLGRMNITTTLGDIDGDGDFDELYCYGARSFSVWDENGVLVWDSGSEFGLQTFAAYPNNFNSTNDDNDSFKNRSDDKGTEPEAIEVGVIGQYRFAFIGLERMGGVMVYDISNPMSPSFVSYFNNRDFSIDADQSGAGDLGPEDVVFIPANESPTNAPILAVASEVSGTLSLYNISTTIGIDEEGETLLKAYPNPVVDVVHFTQEVNGGILYDMSGKAVMEINGETANMSHLSRGLYTLSAGDISLQILKQ